MSPLHAAVNNVVVIQLPDPSAQLAFSVAPSNAIAVHDRE
jgi:hypothetical protein